MSNFDTYSGTITGSAQNVVADCQNNSGVYIWLQGTYAGITVVFEGTADGGTTWQAMGAYNVNTTGTTAQTVTPTANAFVHMYAMVGAAKQFRVRSTAFTSGSMQVNLAAVTDADPILAGSVPTSGASVALADAFANPTEAHQGSDGFLFNGSTWDRERGNVAPASMEATLSGKTANFKGATQTNYNAAGAIMQLNVSVATGTPTLVAQVEYSIDGTNWVVLDSVNAATQSITATGVYTIKVYPGIPTVAAGSCNSPLPRQWRLGYTIGGTTPSFTFATHVTYIN